MGSNHNGDFLKGALLGGLLGGAAGLLVAPKSGKELRDDLTENYNSLNEKAHSLAENLKETGSRIAHPFREIEEDHHSHNGFLIGGAVGAVIGATAAMLLAPKAGEKLREELGDKYEEVRSQAEDFVTNFNTTSRDALEKVGDWKETLVDILGKFSKDKKHKNGQSKVDDMMEWAGLGIRLLQQLQKGRK